MHSVVIRAKPVNLSSVERSSPEPIDPIVFAELPSEEQEIARTAIEEEEYRKCYFNLDSSKKDAVSSLSRRGCYLKRDQESYKLHGWILDDAIC